MKKINLNLSIIVPSYSKKTIKKLLLKLNELKNIKKMIIVVNDASTDGTTKVLNDNKRYIKHLIHHKKNVGKGGAIKTAKKFVKGNVVIIQDGDLEYNPLDYQKMLSLISKGYKVDCITFDYGQRHIKEIECARLICKENKLKNLSIEIANVESIFAKSALTSNEIEMPHGSYQAESMQTTIVPNRNMLFISHAIAYAISEGKKIRFIDGIKAVLTLFKYRFFR